MTSISSKSRRGRIQDEAEFHVFNRTWKRYRLIIIRNKISFSAFYKTMTIQELFFRTIMETLIISNKAGRCMFDADQEKGYSGMGTALRKKLGIPAGAQLWVFDIGDVPAGG